MTLQNPPTEPQIPQAIARDAEVAAAVAAHAAASAPHSGHLPKNPTGIEFGQALNNIFDFHAGTEPVDFDARLVASAGTGQNGRGSLSLQAGRLDLVGGLLLSLNGGASLRRVLVGEFSINPPNVAVASVADIDLSLPGAVAGDFVVFTPVTTPYNGLWAFNTTAVCLAANTVKVFFHNAYNAPVDVPQFTARVLVIGFG